jgi:putative ABC transport system permease protein
MGLMVGMVIVYQILFTDVCSHLRGYATLKALGFSHRYLQHVVLGEASILACLGFVPGLLLSAGLYHYVGRAAYLPLELTCDRCVSVFGMILAMCMVAGLLALRKLREADPASVF